MKSETKEYLLKEYDQIWSHLRDVWTTRNNAIALFFAAYGAIAGAGLGLVLKANCDRAGWWLGVSLLGDLLCLPKHFLVPVTLFLALLAAVVLILVVQMQVLSAEYITTVNRVRAAFSANDPDILPRYLVLPTTQHPQRPVYRSDFWILCTIAVLSGAVLGFGLAHLLNWPEIRSYAMSYRPIVRWMPSAVGLGWVLLWTLHYRRRSCEVIKRLRTQPGVTGEVATAGGNAPAS